MTKVILWTGYKIDESTDNATQRRCVEERFAVNFNVPEMDVCIIKIDRSDETPNGHGLHADRSLSNQHPSFGADLSVHHSQLPMDQSGHHQ